MGTSRLFRTAGTVVAAAALLVSGCSSSGVPSPSSAATATAPGPPSPPPGSEHGRRDEVVWRGGNGDGGAGRVDARARETGARDEWPGANRATTALRPLPPVVPAPLRGYYEQRLRWRPCGASGFECATLRVPLDYERPGADRDVRLGVSRKRATDGPRRLGSLLVNPGGPGGSAIGYLQTYAGIGYPRAVRARYDMVAFDPRGVGRSEPVRCLTGREMDAHVRTDQTPNDAAEKRSLVRAYQKLARGCQRGSGRLLGHLSTTEAARDMDVLRAALGDRKLTYVGASYGTFLGATYAGLFPGRTGRLVLDAAMDPSLGAEQMNLEQTAGFETALTAFMTDCVRRADCPLGTDDRAEAVSLLGDLLHRADARALRTEEGRTLTESLATTAVMSAMYDEGAWPALRTALAEAIRGDGTELLQLSDAFYERSDNGTYSNLMVANQAVNCLDLPPAFHSPADASQSLPAFRTASPLFGETLAWAALSCAYWPVEATGRPHRIEARGAAPILVVGTTRDPATPYRWARSLAAQLSSARLLTYDGDGHTAYGRGSECADRTITTYLLTGRLPAPDTTCT
ncbi:alpha/beta fold hydrolase [Streptomyces sp. AC563]|uniref:alpha/beta hydrolase n=1 Tax=Streptomyces buecherae TaxID=2763006 RepID=UPI00164D4F57|nr:alpha/beta hydrolase [Streptomyces buecherae]MBC3989631.1 alpha/beta fold hydrolase [Streptomyces buecherae]